MVSLTMTNDSVRELARSSALLTVILRGGAPKILVVVMVSVTMKTDSVSELVVVVDIKDFDIARWRSKDTGGSDGKCYYDE